MSYEKAKREIATRFKSKPTEVYDAMMEYIDANGEGYLDMFTLEEYKRFVERNPWENYIMFGRYADNIQSDQDYVVWDEWLSDEPDMIKGYYTEELAQWGKEMMNRDLDFLDVCLRKYGYPCEESPNARKPSKATKIAATKRKTTGMTKRSAKTLKPATRRRGATKRTRR